MKCPDCGRQSFIIDTRDSPLGGVIRRRKCRNNHRFTTRELQENKREMQGVSSDIRSAVSEMQKLRKRLHSLESEIVEYLDSIKGGKDEQSRGDAAGSSEGVRPAV